MWPLQDTGTARGATQCTSVFSQGVSNPTPAICDSPLQVQAHLRCSVGHGQFWGVDTGLLHSSVMLMNPVWMMHIPTKGGAKRGWNSQNE